MAKVISITAEGERKLIEVNVSNPNVVLEDVVCNAAVAIGSVVRMASGVAELAVGDTLANSNFIGIVEAKSSATLCTIRVSGVSENNIFSGLDEEKEYYLSTTTLGALTAIPPTSGIMVRVGQPFDSQSMLVLKGMRIKRS